MALRLSDSGAQLFFVVMPLINFLVRVDLSHYCAMFFFLFNSISPVTESRALFIE